MDPYLEQDVVWHDFHERFIPAAAAYLSAQILPRYIVLIGQNVYLHDLEQESFLGIHDRLRREVVSIVELLSPENKRPGGNREKYLRKRSNLLKNAVHFVEMDLLRGGPAMPVPNRPDCDYSIFVNRTDRRPQADFWPVGLRAPLPTVLVPLRAGDEDARLDLRAILDRVYDESGYQCYLYEREPDPPLAGDDAAWARTLIANRSESP
jgi:hypothetical protein